MQEFWFCEACKSMNRGNADSCYRCRAPKKLATMAVVANRPSGAVLTPGLDEEHREVAWTLMARGTYFSAWKLGYVTAALLLLVFAAVVFTVAIEISLMASRRSPTPIAPSESPVLQVALLALLLTGLCAAVMHSVFLGLTSMDTPALGSGSPRFGPVRAGLWWIESGLWAIRAGLAFIVPPLLCLLAMSIGGVIIGLLLGLVWVVCAFWVLGDPIASLGKPGRLLKDLWDRLAVPGSSSSRIVTFWSATWGTARGFDIAIAALTYILIMALAVASFVGSRFGVTLGGSSTDNVTWLAVLLVDLVAAVQWIADAIALCLLARITIELSQRQRIREEWVLGGLGSALARTDAPFAASATGMLAAAPAAGPVEPPAGFVPSVAPLQAVPRAPLPAVPQGPPESAAELDGAASPGSASDRSVIQPSSTSVGRYGSRPQVGSPQPDEPLPEDRGWGEGI